MRLILCAVFLYSIATAAAQGGAKETVEEQFAKRAARLWSLQPVMRPAIPVGVTASANPIDTFIGADYKAKGLVPAGKANRLTLLRRVYFDLIGIPPTTGEQDAFLLDQSPDAYGKLWIACLRTSSMAFAGRATGWMCCDTPIWTAWTDR
jgi:hypothetical protein